MSGASRGATYKTMTRANPSATFDPSEANSDSPICPAITEISATQIAAAVNSAEKKTNRKDFFLGSEENIKVGQTVVCPSSIRAIDRLKSVPLASLNRHSHAPDNLREHGIGVGAVAVAAHVSRIDRDTVAEYGNNQAFDVICDAIGAVFGEGQRLGRAPKR